MKTVDVKLSPGQDFKKLTVGMAEEIEAFVASLILLDGIGDFGKLLNTVARIVKVRDKFQVAPVWFFQQLGQDIETVDVLFHRGDLAFFAAVMVLNFTVMPELGDIVSGCFNPQDDPEFVVHFD